ncbi:integral membrane transporter [Halobacteriales archaeon QS_3_64_16]|nr:MAG: integral membrane transporter [Halobacteriales archaeon QS_3_64_16]
MFFSPCGVGLLPAYLTYFGTSEVGSDADVTEATDTDTDPDRRATGSATSGADRRARSFTRPITVLGTIAFLGGAIPLTYMAVAGIRILLPGYRIVVPLAKLGTGSYLPPVLLVTVGTLLLANGAIAGGSGLRGAYIGIVATIGMAVTYLLVGLPVIVLGQWARSFLTPLELLAGPLLIAIGIAYYRGLSVSNSIPLPERDGRTARNFFGFGVLYGIGSLACNLPVFLGLIVSAFVAEGVGVGLGMFGAFIAGMATLLIGISIAAASSSFSFSPGQYVGRARTLGAVAFVAVGVYVTWFSLVSFGYL